MHSRCFVNAYIVLVGMLSLGVKAQSGSLCYAGIHQVAADQPFVMPLASACIESLPADKSGFWNSKLCVAAGVAAGISQLNDYANCYQGSTVPAPTQYAALDPNVYMSVVGGCTSGITNCPAITEENLVDLVYGQIEEAGLSTTPDSVSDLEQDYIQPIFTFEKVSIAEGISYSQFNDWLHNSGFTSHVPQ
ncbi:hypothetical protein PENSPDRAFT_685428 [Peniophora sp. CONT]|nr:hypothetical protein PENSPDRAFT_685428 [Peniophora sp. CONT]